MELRLRNIIIYKLPDQLHDKENNDYYHYLTTTMDLSSNNSTLSACCASVNFLTECRPKNLVPHMGKQEIIKSCSISGVTVFIGIWIILLSLPYIYKATQNKTPKNLFTKIIKIITSVLVGLCYFVTQLQDLLFCNYLSDYAYASGPLLAIALSTLFSALNSLIIIDSLKLYNTLVMQSSFVSSWNVMIFWKTINTLIILESGIYFFFSLVTSICFHRSCTKIIRARNNDLVFQIFGRITLILMLLGYNFFTWMIITVKTELEHKFASTETVKVIYVIMGQLIAIYFAYAIVEPYIMEYIKRTPPSSFNIPSALMRNTAQGDVQKSNIVTPVQPSVEVTESLQERCV
ncbi:uncharacterized protein VTP21DRAFT_5306 [Calcarisporiella thermophila]|uniref:uncharacterized protein n=1 Tax=Calcarisporiella thermophila TaxID=911321 RepID=UPI00374453E0